MSTPSTTTPASSAAGKREQIAVSKDTHTQIGRFSFVHSLYQEQIVLINAAKKDLQSINDAEEELILVDDESTVPCQLDDPSFFERTKVEAESFLADEKVRIQSRIDEYEAVAAEYLKEIDILRRDLYGKLGNLVQLDSTGAEDEE